MLRLLATKGAFNHVGVRNRPSSLVVVNNAQLLRFHEQDIVDPYWMADVEMNSENNIIAITNLEQFRGLRTTAFLFGPFAYDHIQDERKYNSHAHLYGISRDRHGFSPYNMAAIAADPFVVNYIEDATDHEWNYALELNPNIEDE